jgi:hypothetical protein
MKQETFTIITCSAMFTGVIMVLTDYNPIFGAYTTIFASVAYITAIATGFVKPVKED